MRKIVRTVLIIAAAVMAFIIGASLLIGALWNGTFNFLHPKEIETYHSPNGEYRLVFEQMGDPQWPFGPTDIRLTLQNSSGKTVERVSAQLLDDGVSASERNVKSITWNEDAVVVILSASEMEDKSISIAYRKS
ncbi:MAG: hypothetical protein IKD31_02485 [Clostridia bacterium]|nr:hypothetical protein [Clostridia bacterium]